MESSSSSSLQKNSSSSSSVKGILLLVIVSIVTLFVTSRQTRGYMSLTKSLFESIEQETIDGDGGTQVSTAVPPPPPAASSSSAATSSSGSHQQQVANTTTTTTTNAVVAAEAAAAEAAAAEAAATEAEMEMKRITKPFSNETTFGMHNIYFYSGFRNQVMAFSALIMWADIGKHKQFLMNTLHFKDTFGTNKYISFDTLFDVQHWNSYYPKLPRMVSCSGDDIKDHNMFPDFNCTTKKWINTTGTQPATRTAPQNVLFMNYLRYCKGRGPLAEPGFRNPIDLLILGGALRPHPELQALIDQKLTSLHQQHSSSNSNDTTGITTTTTTIEGGGTTVPYMTLHARVEPDMLEHPVCRHKKVSNLTKIFHMIERRFPNPPAPHVFMPINRQYMEKEGYPNIKHPEKTNWQAVENLKALNHAVTYGLWNGTAKVFEFGSNSLKGTKYERRPSTTGALINFYMAIGANVFIGTEISTYSFDLLSTRHYSGVKENYRYTPEGILQWPDEGMEHPPPFVC